MIKNLSNLSKTRRLISYQLVCKIYTNFIDVATVKFPDKNLIKFVYKNVLLKNLQDFAVQEKPLPLSFTVYLNFWLHSVTSLSHQNDSVLVKTTHNQIYNEASKFLLSKPSLSESNFPNFLSTFFNKDNSYLEKRMYMLEFLNLLVPQIENGYHYKNLAKFDVFNILICNYSNDNFSEYEKNLILEILKSGVDNQYVRKRLIEDVNLKIFVKMAVLQQPEHLTLKSILSSLWKFK